MSVEWIIPFAVGIVSLLGTGWLAHFLRRRGMMDNPNERSSHKIPTPRGGGLAPVCALFLGLGAASTAGTTNLTPMFFAAWAMVIAVGLIDDKLDLSAKIRMAVHVGAAVLVVINCGPMNFIPLPAPIYRDFQWFAYPMTFLWLIGVLNLYNFLDGIDGFAGTQALWVGLGVALILGQPMIGACIAAAALGFLVHNWHPAKIFMGDVGSASLGFLFACLPFYLRPTMVAESIFVMAMLLWFFLADGTFTILRRLSKGEKIWQAHRSHLYQRLTIAGRSHGQVVLLVAMLQAALFAVLVWSGLSLDTHAWLVAVTALGLFGIYWAWVVREEKSQDTVPAKA
ncbi:MraY family glycosyltransferase [Acanthopleuribacter pedis]|uniref:Glycosyltransferase family 4 protein n=1 Tax=Acanthopleuribacter pedis TaxID=442870 RepID=A0A8J7QH99_9BACT|nr:glycosyltransferase family 4 protein [Acanthopleuribacter pedis]MBO1320396.1 glycosyltransferase family 4 protein [Acanthopleuribacter pedis]